MVDRNARTVSIDIEADGPVPGLYSMVSFGAVIVEEGHKRTFYAELRPITDIWVPEALAVSGFTREQTLAFPDPLDAMTRFDEWLIDNIEGRPIMWADNPMFDGGYMNYYFWKYLSKNPFGWSCQGIGSLYKGMQNDVYSKFSHLRDTKHDHNALSDAKGNSEALLKMFKIMKNRKAKNV